ncbi:MAG: FAD-binding oxidoreductase [Limisphaerales bacterium]
MRLKPSTTDDLRQALTAANAAKSRIESCDLSALNRVIEHTPEDMTVTVEGGATLANLQTEVRKRGQWLPIDPPNASITIQQLLASNASGPRRFGFGTVRDYVIGMAVVLADGRLIHSGGKVVKNVAGYDLMKLFIGDKGTLGIVVEVTFKLRPIPEAERFVQQRCGSVADAQKLIDSVLNSPITPTLLDLHNSAGLTVVLGLDGASDEVEWQTARAAELGFTEAATLDYDKAFQQQPAVKKLSVLPSKLAEAISAIGKAPFVARAGNGVIYYSGNEVNWPTAPIPKHLQQRVKETFDPNQILPQL